MLSAEHLCRVAVQVEAIQRSSKATSEQLESELDVAKQALTQHEREFKVRH